MDRVEFATTLAGALTPERNLQTEQWINALTRNHGLVWVRLQDEETPTPRKVRFMGVDSGFDGTRTGECFEWVRSAIAKGRAAHNCVWLLIKKEQELPFLQRQEDKAFWKERAWFWADGQVVGPSPAPELAPDGLRVRP